ncbi:MAG: macro domain-containing protein [Spirochaetota bacterium]
MSAGDERVERSGVTVECVLGSIVDQPDMDAVVNAANAHLQIGGGVAGAIHGAAGPKLAEECRPLAPIRPGDAVITGAGKLPNRHVIHALGPVYGRDTPSQKLLAECYRNSLARAEENGLASVAFPAISTGAFGYPMEEAAEIAMRTTAEEAVRLSSVTLIRFVLFDHASFELHVQAMRRVFGGR